MLWYFTNNKIRRFNFTEGTDIASFYMIQITIQLKRAYSNFGSVLHVTWRHISPFQQKNLYKGQQLLSQKSQYSLHALCTMKELLFAFLLAVASLISFSHGSPYERVGGQCLTTGGAKVNTPCVFPFTARGITYTECTKAGGFSIPWCSTMVDANGENDKWEVLWDPSSPGTDHRCKFVFCPIVQGQIRKGILLEFLYLKDKYKRTNLIFFPGQ